MKKLILSLLAAVFILGLAATNLMGNGDPQLKALGLEIAKISIQLLFVVIIGGVLVQEYSRRRERKASINDFRKSVLRRLFQAYADTKKARRLLRARCSIDADDNHIRSGEIPYATYEKHIQCINDVQLQLEILIHELEVFKKAFTVEANLREEVAALERYLRKVIREYEDVSMKFSKSEHIPLARLERLVEFLLPSKVNKNSEFRKEFIPHFRSAVELIRTESLKV